MIRLVTVVLAVAWALGGVANLGSVPQPQRSAVCVAVAVSLLIAFRAGRRTASATAVASAVATATAVATAAVTADLSARAQSAQAVVVNVHDGAAAVGRRTFGLEDAHWITSSSRAPELEITDDVMSMMDDIGERVEVDR